MAAGRGLNRRFSGLPSGAQPARLFDGWEALAALTRGPSRLLAAPLSSRRADRGRCTRQAGRGLDPGHFAGRLVTAGSVQSGARVVCSLPCFSTSNVEMLRRLQRWQVFAALTERY